MRRFVAFLVFFACAATANAQSYTYSVYIDADANAATGCSVSSPGGALAGIESVLAVTVTAGTPPTVNSVTRSSCSGGILGAPVAEGTAAVSVGAGVGGTTSIEVSDALLNVAPSSTGALHVYAAAQSAGGSDILFTTTGVAIGQAIVLQLAAPGSTVPTPLFGIPALLLLVAGLLAFGSRAVRRRMLKRLMLGLVLLSGIAGAAIFNWNGIGPIATDPPGDSTSGESAIDLRYLLGAFNGSNVFFRLDVNSNLAPPPPKPVAVADTYQDTINTTLTVAAPGVLSNDTLNGGTITSNTNPAHGTLALNVNGGFVYTPTTGYTGQDSFTYTLTNAGGNSIGNVTIVILNGPSAQPDSYTTIVGTALNVSAPGVLANDNLGNPTATLSSFGGGSLGGAVTSHAVGTSAALAGGTLTVNANGSISLTAPTTAGTYTFLYRIGNVQGTSDGTVTIQVNQAPTITSVGPANFSVGVNGTYTITTSGTPTVTSITLTGCTLPAGLSFTYTSGATATISGTATAGGTVSCTVTASNGVSPNATQTLVVNSTAGPVANPDSYSTTVGTALNVSAPGVLGNDNLGSPTATMSSFGGGSLGGSVTTNAPGASVALGASGGTLTLNANGSINLTTPTTAGTYTFQYRIGNHDPGQSGTDDHQRGPGELLGRHERNLQHHHDRHAYGQLDHVDRLRAAGWLEFHLHQRRERDHLRHRDGDRHSGLHRDREQRHRAAGGAEAGGQGQ
ncbi:MAG: hypothetical protein E6K53_13830 [Gammaproteobacteria bacterium]|nr:MAG: hypothetical protein E6K53_13830 [Gammaproteobacteria bacterium]